MKRFLLLFITTLGLNAMIHSPLFAEGKELVATSAEVIGSIRIHVEEEGARAIVYLTPEDGNWSAENCADAKYAYIKAKSGGLMSSDSDVGIAKMIVDLAIASKTNNIPITFEGECGNTNGNEEYFRIVYATL